MSLSNKIWKVINQPYDNYSVSNYGEVRNDNTGLILNGNRHNRGYSLIQLCNDGKCKNYLIHRLVAEYFIPNPNNFPLVNHKDEVKKNNHVDNLEWCDYQYNNSYGSCSKPVRQLTKDGILIREWNSPTIASKELKLHRSHIYACCNGDRKSHGGYRWEYV